MRALRAGATATLCLFVVAMGGGSALAAASRPCIPAEAAASAAVAAFQSEGTFAVPSAAALRKMQAINAKAKVPNRPIKDQLSNAEIREFNAARTDLIKLSMIQSSISRNERNMRLLDQLMQYAEIMDLYGFDPHTLEKGDPRSIYFTLIDALREAQPTPPETVLPDPKGGCTMEAALSLEEHFYMNEMALEPTNAGMLNLILDSRRLSQLRSVMQKAVELDQYDAANIRVDASGEPVSVGDSFSKWLTEQPKSSQIMGGVILNSIDTILPSKSNYQIRSQAERSKQIKAEYEH